MRDDSPYIPYSAQEIAEEARRCVAAGASIIHLHVRNPDGSPSQ
ncbi:MAG TPA: 3-keto-5-aminohexanoate cleavage protein, partial [Polyangiales bacterium]